MKTCLALILFFMCPLAYSAPSCNVFKSSETLTLPDEKIYQEGAPHYRQYRMRSSVPAVSLEPNSAETWLWQARTCHLGKQPDCEFAAAKRAYHLEPENLRVLHSVVVHFKQTGHAAEALEVVQGGLKKFPIDPALLLQNFRILVKLKHLTEALRAAEAVPMMARSPSYYCDLVQVYRNLRRLEEGQRALEAVIVKGRAIPQVYLLQAQLLRDLGRPIPALAALEQGLSRGMTDFAEVLFVQLQGALTMAINHREEGLALLKQAFERHPHSLSLKREYLRGLLRAQLFVDANAVADSILKKDPTCLIALTAKAQISLDSGDVDQALKFVSSMKPPFTDRDLRIISIIQLRAMLIEGKFQEALDFASKLPLLGREHWFMAIAYSALGDKDRVVDSLLEYYRQGSTVGGHLGLAALVHIFKDRQFPPELSRALRFLSDDENRKVYGAVQRMQRDGSPFDQLNHRSRQNQNSFMEEAWL